MDNRADVSSGKRSGRVAMSMTQRSMVRHSPWRPAMPARVIITAATPWWSPSRLMSSSASSSAVMARVSSPGGASIPICISAYDRGDGRPAARATLTASSRASSARAGCADRVVPRKSSDRARAYGSPVAAAASIHRSTCSCMASLSRKYASTPEAMWTHGSCVPSRAWHSCALAASASASSKSRRSVQAKEANAATRGYCG
jgi:hypothetical protein